jgi:hypothetical protein
MLAETEAYSGKENREDAGGSSQVAKSLLTLTRIPSNNLWNLTVSYNESPSVEIQYVKRSDTAR